METKIGKVEFYNQHGEGVIFDDNKPIYVYGTIKNEIVEYKIIETKKTYGIGKVLNVIEKSKNRVDHNIENADLIGGYDLIHMNDEEQKKFKIERVLSDFKKISKTEIDNWEWFSGKNKTKYRNKITVHDGFFYKKNTNEKIEIEDFLLSDIEWDRNKKGTIIYRKLNTLIWGHEKEKIYTTDDLLGYKFRVGLNSFYQINKEVTEFAYSKIIENILENKNTLDLYCGIGTIGIVASSKSKNVVGVEIDKNSYEDALYNKELNHIENIDFYNSDVKKFVKNNKTHFENVILDPARSGVGKETIFIIRDYIQPERIVYMSCNPGTQASDYNHLKDKYKIDKLFILDMFPQTYHIETILVLTRK